jgi:hypothetical protein
MEPIYKDISSLAIDYFTKLFEIGNSIRGWSGTGPYVSLDSRPVLQFESLVYPRLIAFSDCVNSLPEDLKSKLNNLRIRHYYNGTFSQDGGCIGDYYLHLTIGRLSANIASGNLMSTAIYYLKEQYNYEIPNVDITTLKLYY